MVNTNSIRERLTMRKLAVAAFAAATLAVAACSSPPPPPPPAPTVQVNTWTQRLAKLKADLEAATQGTGAVVQQTPDNLLKVVMPNELSFDVGRSSVKRNLAQVLDKIGDGLNGATTASVLVVGHTDNTGGDSANDRLSVARADSARDHLTAKGVAPTTITTKGRGEREPVADNKTAASRAQNRRIELFVSEKQ